MSLSDARSQLVTARARSIAGGRYAALAVGGALLAVVAGQDGETLRELAGLSRESRDEDVEDLLEQALEDIGVDVPIATEDAQIVVLRDMVSECLNGRLTLRTVTDWAHSVIGHDGPAVAQTIVDLDDQADATGPIRDAQSRPILQSFLRDSSPVLERLTAIHSG